MAKRSLKIPAPKEELLPEEDRFPQIFVTEKMMPEIVTWEPGEKYDLKVTITMPRKSETSEEDGNDTEAIIELRSYEVAEKSID